VDFCRPYTSKPVAPHSIYQPSWYETHRMPRFWWSKWSIVGCVLGATLGGPNCPGDIYLGVLCATHFGAIRKLPSHVWPSEPKVLGISVKEIDWLIARPHVPRQMAMFVASVPRFKTLVMRAGLRTIVSYIEWFYFTQVVILGIFTST